MTKQELVEKLVDRTSITPAQLKETLVKGLLETMTGGIWEKLIGCDHPFIKAEWEARLASMPQDVEDLINGIPLEMAEGILADIAKVKREMYSQLTDSDCDVLLLGAPVSDALLNKISRLTEDTYSKSEQITKTRLGAYWVPAIDKLMNK